MSMILTIAAATVLTVGGQRFKTVGNGGLQQYSGNCSSSRVVRKVPAVRANLITADSDETRNVLASQGQEVIPSSTSSSRPWSTKMMGSALAATLTMAQALAPFPESLAEFWSVPRAEAVLYSPDTKVPRSAEVALRRAIPAVNPSMKKMQESLEDIFYLLRIPQRKPYGTMESDVKKALQLLKDDKDAILAAVPADLKERGLELYNQLTGPSGLEKMLDAIAAKDADKVSIRLANSLEMISELEIIQAPGLAFLVPASYQEYPRLTGRATVQMKLEKGDGSSFTVAAGGGPQKTGELEIALDGYSSPLTAGNFADLVLKGKYNNVKLRTGEQSILCDDQGDGVGNPIPLEILPAGEFQPLYQTTLDVQDGEIPMLPLSVYGAVAMAHNVQAEDFSSPSQFFFYLYDKRNAGLGGLAFDEGQFSVFGYVTKGKELLSQLKTGDIIQTATLVSGQDRLVLPSSGN
ncbi:hypothetical protein R1flu_012397 [Riccia fluitans]|uniref:PPIase cyclophilin-type domain-containing protein n=1 Tax=Riccia fluitans TaxID=41844 RepID=A0ABD1ZBH4_9MARC